MVTSHWGSSFQGYPPFGRGSVACVLPAVGEGRFYDYFLLGKLVSG